jgi:hypothetical protein
MAFTALPHPAATQAVSQSHRSASKNSPLTTGVFYSALTGSRGHPQKCRSAGALQSRLTFLTLLAQSLHLKDLQNQSFGFSSDISSILNPLFLLLSGGSLPQLLLLTGTNCVCPRILTLSPQHPGFLFQESHIDRSSLAAILADV